VGAFFLVAYVATIGVATYLLKVSTTEDLSAYQVNLLMAGGMAVTAIPALWIAQGSLSIPKRALPLGALVGLLMAAGSILYVLAVAKLPVGPASAIATSYVVIVVVLSALFLDEKIDAVTIAGIVLTLAGVALLSLRV
jgi:drug/metabolite transporter (DMT)-like permease